MDLPTTLTNPEAFFYADDIFKNARTAPGLENATRDQVLRNVHFIESHHLLPSGRCELSHMIQQLVELDDNFLIMQLNRLLHRFLDHAPVNTHPRAFDLAFADNQLFFLDENRGRVRLAKVIRSSTRVSSDVRMRGTRCLDLNRQVEQQAGNRADQVHHS